jgi:hypothetical protein
LFGTYAATSRVIVCCILVFSICVGGLHALLFGTYAATSRYLSRYNDLEPTHSQVCFLSLILLSSKVYDKFQTIEKQIIVLQKHYKRKYIEEEMMLGKNTIYVLVSLVAFLAHSKFRVRHNLCNYVK